jgi:hypothetical protein
VQVTVDVGTGKPLFDGFVEQETVGISVSRSLALSKEERLHAFFTFYTSELFF